jgi:predicted acyl esterase
MTAALAAAAQPPALGAVFPQAAPADPFGIDMAPEGGGLKVETLLLQGASLAFDVCPAHVEARCIAPAEVPDFVEPIGGYFGALAQGIEDPLSSAVWMAAPIDQSEELARLMPFWSLLTDAGVFATYRAELDVRGDIAVPTSIVSLWQDSFVPSAVALHEDLVERDVPTELLVVNGSHCEIDDPRIYPEPRMLSWFDRWLKDGPTPARATVALAVQGTGGEFLRADGMADLLAPALVVHLTADGGRGTPADFAEAEVVFTSDPADPVPTLGGRNLLAAGGMQDHASLLGRRDVAVFRTAPAVAETWIAGPVSAQLTVRTDAPSFDVSARLLDIAPDGTANLVLSHLARVTGAAPGETRLSVDLGHRSSDQSRAPARASPGRFGLPGLGPQSADRRRSLQVRRYATRHSAIVTGGGPPSTLAIPLIAAN